ncbi:uncharacterized protein LOC144577990 [Callithrix jacchus]
MQPTGVFTGQHMKNYWIISIDVPSRSLNISSIISNLQWSLSRKPATRHTASVLLFLLLWVTSWKRGEMNHATIPRDALCEVGTSCGLSTRAHAWVQDMYPLAMARIPACRLLLRTSPSPVTSSGPDSWLHPSVSTNPQSAPWWEHSFSC